MTHGFARLAGGLQRDGPGHGEPAALGHVDLSVIDPVPVEALDERGEHEAGGPQSERLPGAPAPSHPERQHQPALGLAVAEPLRPELVRLLPRRRVPVDGVRVDEQQRAAGHVVAADRAVRRRLVRQQQRGHRVQAQRLVDDALQVAQPGHVVHGDEAGRAHGRLDLCLGLLQRLRVVQQQRHGPFYRGRRRLRSGCKQVLFFWFQSQPGMDRFVRAENDRQSVNVSVTYGIDGSYGHNNGEEKQKIALAGDGLTHPAQCHDHGVRVHVRLRLLQREHHGDHALLLVAVAVAVQPPPLRVDEPLQEGVPPADNVPDLVPHPEHVEPPQERQVVPQVGGAEVGQDLVDDPPELVRLGRHGVVRVVGARRLGLRDGLHEHAEGELEQTGLELDAPCRLGRAPHPAQHGAHLGRDDGAHARHAVRGEEAHGGHAPEVAPVGPVARHGQRGAAEGGQRLRGQSGAVGERHVVLREARLGALRRRHHHGGAGAQAQREHGAVARREAGQRRVERALRC
jgi:hypothetical protein